MGSGTQHCDRLGTNVSNKEVKTVLQIRDVYRIFSHPGYRIQVKKGGKIISCLIFFVAFRCHKI
jgi:hypothetical protein